ncbi:hypothetical protein AN958_01259 [Leucoagaricus sp. SymC.cos]|nr:hypothetical protein AN958_01259 [Leucoagaricus sp. SymC.cos]
MMSRMTTYRSYSKPVHSHETKTVAMYLQLMQNMDVGVNESHLLALGHIVELESADPGPEVTLFEAAQVELNNWMEHCRSQIHGNSTAEVKNGLDKLLGRAVQVEQSIDFLRRLVTSRTQS